MRDGWLITCLRNISIIEAAPTWVPCKDFAPDDAERDRIVALLEKDGCRLIESKLLQDVSSAMIWGQ